MSVFVTFEGIEGCGKSTQLRRVAARLAAEGRDVVATREPGATPLGRRLRELLLDAAGAPIDPGAELLLYAADRLQHVVEVVLPALRAGRWVLCDRYLDATLAYQGFGRGLGTAAVEALHRDPPLDLRPDRTLLLDLEPATALARARERDRRSGDGVREGRFEAEELEFHRRVQEGYLELARAAPERIRRIDAAGDEDAVEARCLEALAGLGS